MEDALCSCCTLIMSSTFCELFNSHFFLYISHELHGRRGQHLLNLPSIQSYIIVFITISLGRGCTTCVARSTAFFSFSFSGHYSRLETPDRAEDVRRAHNRSKNFDQNRKQNPRKTWTRLRSLRRKFSERNQKNTKPHQRANPKTGFNFWRKPRSK